MESQIILPLNQRMFKSEAIKEAFAIADTQTLLLVIKAYHEALVAAEKQYEELKACSVSWAKEDFLQAAKEEGYMITPHQAQELLREMIKGHDAGYGINWDTVKELIQNNCEPTEQKRKELEKLQKDYQDWIDSVQKKKAEMSHTPFLAHEI